MRFDVVWENLPYLLQASITTVGVSALACGIGVILGALSGLLSVSHSAPLRWLAKTYVEAFRGTPLLVQILITYFGLGGLGIYLSAFQAGVVSLSLNAGAYISEIVRAGISSVDRGQIDAAKSIGLSWRQTLTLLLLPQATRRMIPPVTNELISLIKASSLLAIIGMLELTHAGQVVIARTFTPFEIYIAVAIIYLVIVSVVAQVSRLLEARIGRDF